MNKSKQELNAELEALDEMMTSLLEQRMKLISEKNDVENSENYVLDLPNKQIDAKTLTAYKKKFTSKLEDLDELFTNQLDQKNDDFLKDGADYSTFNDVTFAIATQAKNDQDPNKINATLGSLFTEKGKILALNTVYDIFNNVPNETKAAYAEGFLGNKAFRDGIFKWINRNNQIRIPHDVIATAGGTGAISLCINNLISENETILFPRVAWGSYKLMAKNANVKTAFYELIDKDNNIDLTDLMLQSLRIIKQQGKLVVVINDPCQNPTGLSYGSERWKLLIEFYKKLTEYGKVIIINDIAYIDFCYEDGYDYMKYFNDMNDDMLLVACFSCSKSFTAYGQRVGAAVIMSTNNQTVERVTNVFSKQCRGLWSNINNGFMTAVGEVTNNHLSDYNNEIKPYVDLLKQRSDIFLQAAKECGLPMYPYTEGFFIFIREEDSEIRRKAHKYLLDHHVYILNFEGGLRVAICSLPLKDCAKLPLAIKEALEVAKND